MQTILFLLITCVVFNGCVSVDTINEHFSTVDPSDGVDQMEAEYIAQKQCLIDPWCKGEMKVSYPEVHDGAGEKEPGRWNVYFFSKDLRALEHIYLVHIDKRSGKVLKTELIQKSFDAKR